MKYMKNVLDNFQKYLTEKDIEFLKLNILNCSEIESKNKFNKVISDPYNS